MIEMIFWVTVIVVAALLGAVIAHQAKTYRVVTSEYRVPEDGWIYFLEHEAEQDDDEKPGLIKIGRTRSDPVKNGLPGDGMMDLTLIRSFWTKDARRSELQIHHDLAAYRYRGEWFDRDATLAYLDGHKGAV